MANGLRGLVLHNRTNDGHPTHCYVGVRCGGGLAFSAAFATIHDSAGNWRPVGKKKHHFEAGNSRRVVR
jgi:hypothetical protein